MNKALSLSAFLLIAVMLCTFLSSCSEGLPFYYPVKITSVAYNKSEIAQYEMLEATVAFKAEYENPFDPEDILVKAEITTPSGKKISVNGFADYPLDASLLQTWKDEDNVKAAIPKGKEVFKIRFSYGETGNYKMLVTVKNKKSKTTKNCTGFKVVQSDKNNKAMWAKGPIQRSKTSPNYFSYVDSGKGYVPVGYAIAWSWPEKLAEYNANVDLLSDNGGNFTRIWGNGIGQTLSLETKNFGLGKYQNNHIEAQELIFNHLREKNVTVQYSFDSFTSLQSDPQWYGEWQNNPYSKANGGIIDTPYEYYTDETCIKLTKRKIQYILARWGWDTNITMFELMNEIDGTEPFASAGASVAAWAKEIAAFIKELDYYKRPIASSYANPKGSPLINNLNEMDFVITHFYDEDDFAQGTNKYVTYNLREYRKPVLIGEFGPIDKNFGLGEDGLYFQEGLWSSIASGSMMSAQAWWWDSVIAYYGLSKQLKPLRSFVDSFDFTKENLEDIKGLSNNENIDVFGRINEKRNRGFSWIHNKQNGWKRIYENGRNGILSEPLTDVNISFKAENGTYKVDYYDTWSEDNNQAPVLTRQIEVTDGKLTIPFNSVYIDTAVMFNKVK